MQQQHHGEKMIEQQIEDFKMDEMSLQIPMMENNSFQITEKGIKFFPADLMLDRQKGITKISQNITIHNKFHINDKDLDIFQIIGKGASSNVNRGIYKKNGLKIQVAVKSISAYEKSLRQQILNDLKTFLEDYNCPNLVTFYGCYYVSGHINQVIQYMDLGSLRSIIKLVYTKKIIIPQIVLSNIAVNILNGLRYIHTQKKKIHRDIKPQNILINSNGEIKITDFGISKNLGKTHGMSNTFVGTLIYMSPQRIKPPTNYDYLSDIWSFGVIMYELATGVNPYKFDKEKAALYRILEILDQKQPQLSEQTFSFEFRDFIKCCLSKDTSKRWSAIQLMNHIWITKFNHANNGAIYNWIQLLKKEKCL